ncbi:MAG: hypothetical protein ACRCSV_00340 [Chlamydiales bacterium]
MQRIFLFLICVFCSGCQRSFVTVVQEKMHRSLLASSFVDSPDPMQYNPPRGKKLYISWNIDADRSFEDCLIRISMIFRNRNVKTLDVPIPRKRGTIVYSLLDQEYYEIQGLLTYKVEIVAKNEEILAVWTHQMWVDIIKLKNSEIDTKAQVIQHFNEQ